MFAIPLRLDPVLAHPILACLLISISAYVLYYRFFHSLARYPGPFLASLTNLWITKVSVDGDWPQRLQRLHKRYGPVVRIAPNEVSVDHVDAIPKIYGIGKGFTKTSFYAMFGDPKYKPNIFNERDEATHAQQKRWSGSAYAMKSVIEMESNQETAIASLIANLDKSAASSSNVDLGAQLKAFAFDVSGLISVGHSFNTIEKGDENGLMAAMALSNVFGAHVGRLPSFVHKLLQSGLLPPPPELIRGLEYLDKFIQKNFELMKLHGPTEKTQMGRFMEAKADEKDSTSYNLLMNPTDRVTRECATVVAAGSDTTGTTLTALFYHILNNPRIYQKLKGECSASLAEANQESFNASLVNRMPYLEACIKEALRIHPAVGFTLPRMVPPEGLVIGESVFEKGTVVGVSAFQHHHHEEIYGSNCSEYLPERWIDAPKDVLALRERNLFSFGGGSRTCVGKHIALLTMRLVVPSLVLRYDFELLEKGQPLQYKTAWFAIAEHLPVNISKTMSI